MGTSFKHIAFLIVMTVIFAGLALDISVPAVVLSLMAFARNVVSYDLALSMPEGRAA